MKWKIWFFSVFSSILFPDWLHLESSMSELKGFYWRITSFSDGCFNTQPVSDFSSLTLRVLIPNGAQFFSFGSRNPFEELNWLLNRFTVYESTIRQRLLLWRQFFFLLLKTLLGPVLIVDNFSLHLVLLMALWWSTTFDEKRT